MSVPPVGNDSDFESEFGRILEDSLNEIYIFDARSLRFIQVNHGARENLGYSMDELRELTPVDLKPEFTRASFEKLLAPLRDGAQQRAVFETRHLRRDGSEYDVEVHLQTSIFHGAPAFVAIILDTTVRNRDAEVLRIRTNVIEAATVGMVITDPAQEDNPIVYCNPAFERITGYTTSDVVGHNCRFLQADDRNQSAIHKMREAVREGRHFRAVLRNYRKDGEPFWNELTITPVRNSSGQISNFIGIVNDVTAQRCAEDESHDNEARLSAILENAVESIITIDEHGTCESANQAVEKMFGYDASEILGKNVSMLMPTPYSEAHDSYIANYLRTGEKKIIGIGRDVVGRRRDGSEFPLHLSVSEVRLGDRRIFTGFLQDLSERKEYEARLVQSERLAAVGEAIASVAHESRNLLQKIQISLELSRLTSVGDDALGEQLDNIEAASDGLFALLEEVRDYAAPLKIDAALHGLRGLVTEAWNIAAGAVPESEAQLQFVEPQDISLQIDRFRMLRVFRNLFENAIAACPEPIKITVSVTESHAGVKPAVSISVQDNGPGLNEEQKRRIFEPFFTTKSKGTGLGMAIAQKIVSAHGGSLSVDEESVGGAKFCITLPV